MPEFLTTLRVGAPAVWIFFDIFIGEYCLKGPTWMIEIQHILDQEPVGVERGPEEFIDPLTNTFAHRYWLTCGRGAMSGHNHTDTRQALAEVGSQHLLDLGMLQDAIASSPRHQVHACFNELSDH